MFVETNVLDGRPVYRPNTSDKHVMAILGTNPCDGCNHAGCVECDFSQPPIARSRVFSRLVKRLTLNVDYCEKCGKTGEVYDEPYCLSPHKICAECDDVLYNFIFCALGDAIDCLNYVTPRDRRYPIIRSIIEAFFFKAG